MPRTTKVAKPTFAPSVVVNPTCPLGGRFARLLVVAETFCGVRVVEQRATLASQIGVVDRVIPSWQLHNYRPPAIASAETSLQSVIDGLKKACLLHGGTHEAVMLLGTLSPFTEEELKVMAEKLKTKASGGAKKPAAAKAPAAEKTAKVAAPKGDRAAPADKSYKHLMTPAKAAEACRAGSWTARMVEIIMSTKSTAEARAALAKDKDYSDKALDFGWAAKKGFISTPA